MVYIHFKSVLSALNVSNTLYAYMTVSNKCRLSIDLTRGSSTEVGISAHDTTTNASSTPESTIIDHAVILGLKLYMYKFDTRFFDNETCTKPNVKAEHDVLRIE